MGLEKSAQDSFVCYSTEENLTWSECHPMCAVIATSKANLSAEVGESSKPTSLVLHTEPTQRSLQPHPGQPGHHSEKSFHMQNDRHAHGYPTSPHEAVVAEEHNTFSLPEKMSPAERTAIRASSLLSREHLTWPNCVQLDAEGPLGPPAGPAGPAGHRQPQPVGKPTR